MRPVVLILATLFLAQPVLAQPAFVQLPAPVTASPYAGQEQRAIKALSPEEMRDLAEGRGMGLAKAAELNGYPGPAHVLELAATLGLNAAQEAATRDIYARMQAETRRLGAAILDAETQLERRFAHRHIDPESLRDSISAIAVLQGRLRTAHLEAHLAQAQLLTPEQIAAYNASRGYHGNQSGHESHGR